MLQLIKKFMSWIDDPTDFRMERFLSQSSDIADLDYRMQKWTYMSESEKQRY
jgi:hypothetical protein